MIMMKSFAVVFLIFFSTIVDAKLSNKIIGGSERVIEQHPHHASVQFLGHPICAGSIISEYHIITTASCVIFEKNTINVFAGNLKVLVGTSDVFNIHELGQLIDVKLIIWHEHYIPEQFWKNDIAILRLEKPIKLSRKSEIISLRPYRIYHGHYYYMTNWADDIYQKNFGFYLKFIYVRALSLTDCSKTFTAFLFTYIIQGCAHTSNDNDAFNMGDGGIGIIHGQEIVGISSIYMPDQPHFFIFTKVFRYVEFITNTINNY